ncbi:uncharacterized protein LOC123291691 [Chrysoperla carnea]|uniref:uncharacterized protein LOC123291691 n=1 Tax=Chrysoperla carnea TaxID=189513 RepID=UPI001D06E74E|nr:uncharacterized protein LOC123291691 [Chrysoperla carnea]
MTSTSLFLLLLVVIVGCTSVTAQNECTAVSGKSGQCILIQYCPSLYAISRKPNLTANDRSILLNSQCGSEGTAPKVCCEDVVRPIVSQTVTAGGGCTTPNNINGRCIELKTCDPLYQVLTKRPLTTENRELLRKSQCGVIGRQPLVCCPPTVATTTTTELPVPNIETGNDIAPRSNLLPPYSECGSSQNDDKILGGEPTTITEFPWMAMLQYERDNTIRFGCGGAVISKRYVLTAAHCVKGLVVSSLGNLRSVRLGEYDVNNVTDCQVTQGCSDPPQIIEIEEIIPHTGWIEKNPSKHNDIALLRLKRDVKFSPFIRPICLPNKGREIQLPDETSVQQSLFVAGWGLTERGVSSNVKLKLKIPLKPLSQCQNEYRRISPTNIDLKQRTQFCAGGEDAKDTCKGDSGGPAMSLYIDPNQDARVVWFCTGIVSFGPFPCGQPGIPGVYTKTNEFIDWILSKMRPKLQFNIPAITMTSISAILMLFIFDFFTITKQNECEAPNGRIGRCILIQYCPTLYSLSMTKPLPKEDRIRLKNALCGSELTSPKVCCEDLELPIFNDRFPRPIHRDGTCKTQNNKNGICMELRSCKALNQVLNLTTTSQKQPSFESRQLLRKSQCGVIGIEPLVCCPQTATALTPPMLHVPNIDTGNEITPRSPLLTYDSECGFSEHDDNKILSGEIASILDFPWMALLQYEGAAEFGCSGALISKRYVLTAAHCVKDTKLGDLKQIRLGEHNVASITDCQLGIGCNEPPQDIEVEEIIPHAGWWKDDSEVQHNDIALVRLKQEANFTNFVKPICLPNKGREILGENEEGRNTVFVAGWGLIDTEHVSSVKLKLEILVKPLSHCEHSYHRILDNQTQFCAGGQEKKDTCKGDSGGPAMSYIYISDEKHDQPKWFCTGIVSFGPIPCGQHGVPGVYTKTNAYIDWILSNMRP